MWYVFSSFWCFHVPSGEERLMFLFQFKGDSVGLSLQSQNEKLYMHVNRFRTIRSVCFPRFWLSEIKPVNFFLLKISWLIRTQEGTGVMSTDHWVTSLEACWSSRSEGWNGNSFQVGHQRCFRFNALSPPARTLRHQPWEDTRRQNWQLSVCLNPH